MKKNNTLVIVLIIIIIVLVGYIVIKSKNNGTVASDTATNSQVVKDTSDQTSGSKSNTQTTSNGTTKTFTNSKYSFSIQYPTNFTSEETNSDGYFDHLNLYSVTLRTPSSYQANTNFDQAWVAISVDPSTKDCYTLNSENNTPMTSTRIIGDKSFHYDPGQPIDDSAMGGQQGEDSVFALVENGQCYRVQKTIGWHTLSAGKQQFDKSKVNADLDTIISTLVIK